MRPAKIHGVLAFEVWRQRMPNPVGILDPEHRGAARSVPDSRFGLSRRSERLGANPLFPELRHFAPDGEDFPSQDCKLGGAVLGEPSYAYRDPVGIQHGPKPSSQTFNSGVLGPNSPAGPDLRRARMPELPLQTSGSPYSYLNACTGSSFAARLAGYKPESRLTRIENRIAANTNHQGTDHICSGVKC